jgi:4-hydroxy-3-methylbut-2-en-1-yl diphosphate reductase
MIHNQEVNNDLQSRGIKFIMDTDGKQFIPWDELKKEDIVIIPAFGTTLEIEQLLLDRGLEVQQYNTTCPFVEKVWNRSEKLGTDDYTVVIHGKPKHEETRATFSHSAKRAASIVVSDMADAKRLGEYMLAEKSREKFFETFAGKYSEGFDPAIHLQRVGVVNQTTMLATETQAIADYFKQVMITRYGAENIKQHFADTRDTLCYATNDNQSATYELLKTGADFAVIVGGYNSSNTSHIVELCEEKFPTYFINSEAEIKSKEEIHHFNIHTKQKEVMHNFLPNHRPVKIVLTSGASCPDTLVDRVMIQLLEFFDSTRVIDDVLHEFTK